MPVREIVSWPRQRVPSRAQRIYGLRLRQPWLAHAPYACQWTISPHVLYAISQTIIQHDHEHSSKSTHISTRTDFDFIRGSFCYVIQAIQHLHSPGLHAQLCMDGPVSVPLSLGIERWHVRVAAVAGAYAAATGLVNGVLDDLQGSNVRGMGK
ncbi:hypothetical protein BGY98DRAFT_281308 [Russula aff. rugulosa BPL654]|nr:hypothetical protein BGY98DRAFT_281308 [Russula aff. rugulosa BPL654]